MALFPHVTAMVLEKKIPDHRPILLAEHWADYGPSSFRMFHSWLSMEGFDGVVREAWVGSGLGVTNPWVAFKKKLQHLKGKLKEWNKVVRLTGDSGGRNCNRG